MIHLLIKERNIELIIDFYIKLMCDQNIELIKLFCYKNFYFNKLYIINLKMSSSQK